MKTSEFIRKAVDANLTTNAIMKGSRTRFLCNALEFYMQDNDNRLEAQFQAVQALIAEGLYGHGTVTGTCHGLTVEEIQGIRFMYAEFLALYFEDEND